MNRTRLGTRLPVLSVIAITLVVLLAAACASASRASVRSIDEILIGPIEISDLSPTAAAVRAETGIEVVCSVVYGLDDDYGSQSTDPGMGGLPHRQHHAPLRGLQPDTEYHYRLQGTGPDGTVYVSDDLTFRTPPAAATGSPARGDNVASAAAGARIVEASSAFGDSATWAPQNAIDGDPNSEWSSAGDGDAAFVTVELAGPGALGAVGMWTRTMGSSAEASQFRVVTEDGAILGPFDLPGADRLYVFPVEVTAQRLRFEVVASSGGNTGVVEIAAFLAAP